MRSLWQFFLGIGLSLAALTGGALAADAPPAGPIHVTGYVEVVPTATDEMIRAVKRYRDAARGEPGVMAVEIYQELGMPSRVVTREIWRDSQSYETHSKAASTAAFIDALKAVRYGPFDFRAHSVHFSHSASPNQAPGAGAVVIISHLDVTPSGIPQLLDLMKPLSEGTAKEPGALTYQILRQTAGARNHFRLFEVWANEKDWEAHNLARHTQAFRDGLAPMLGTPYDQRKYALID